MQELGAEAMEGIAEFKLGLSQELVGQFDGEDPGGSSGFIEKGLVEEENESLGLGFLVGRKGEAQA